MTNDNIWIKINSWKSKYDDYVVDYWALSSAKSNLSESASGLTLLYSTQYAKVKEELTDSLGVLKEFKEKLALTNSSLKTDVDTTAENISSAMTALTDAMDVAQEKINYYYGLLD